MTSVSAANQVFVPGAPSLTEIHIPHIGNIAKDRLALEVVAAAATTLTALVALQVVAFTPLLALINGVAFGVLAGMFVVFHFSRSAPVLPQVPAVPVLPQAPVVPVLPIGVEAAGGREAVVAAFEAFQEFLRWPSEDMRQIISERVMYDFALPLVRIARADLPVPARPEEGQVLEGVHEHEGLQWLGEVEDGFVRVMHNHRRAIEAIVPQEAIRNIWGAFDEAKRAFRTRSFSMPADAACPMGVEAAGGRQAVEEAWDALQRFAGDCGEELVRVVPDRVIYDLGIPFVAIVQEGFVLPPRPQEDRPLGGVRATGGGLETLGVVEDSFLEFLRDHAQAIRAIVPYPAIYAMWDAFDAATRAWRDNPQPIVELEEEGDAIPI